MIQRNAFMIQVLSNSTFLQSCRYWISKMNYSTDQSRKCQPAKWPNVLSNVLSFTVTFKCVSLIFSTLNFHAPKKSNNLAPLKIHTSLKFKPLSFTCLLMLHQNSIDLFQLNGCTILVWIDTMPIWLVRQHLIHSLYFLHTYLHIHSAENLPILLFFTPWAALILSPGILGKKSLFWVFCQNYLYPSFGRRQMSSFWNHKK